MNPVRLDAVSDPNFSYWHSATFNNDGTKVIFTDEWGGGTSARCRVTDQPEWGADALFDIDGDQMEFASYYKMPARADHAGELRRPQLLAGAGAGSRHPRAGLVPGRRVGHRLQRHRQPRRDRLLRPRADQHPEPDRPQPRRPLVDLLVQRPGLRQRDRSRLRHLRADDQRPAERERARRGPRGRSSTSSTPSTRSRSSGRRASTSSAPTSTRPSAPASSPGRPRQGVQAPREGREALADKGAGASAKATSSPTPSGSLRRLRRPGRAQAGDPQSCATASEQGGRRHRSGGGAPLSGGVGAGRRSARRRARPTTPRSRWRRPRR